MYICWLTAWDTDPQSPDSKANVIFVDLDPKGVLNFYSVIVDWSTAVQAILESDIAQPSVLGGAR